MILLTCSNWQLQIPSSWLAGKVKLPLLLPFRLPHVRHSSVNPEKTKQQPSLTNTSEVMYFFLSLANINSSPSLCCFFQSLGTLSPYSQVSLSPPPRPSVHIRTLETGWDLLTRVVSSLHWDTCLDVHFPPRLSPQDYDSLDMKQRRCSSPGYIDSPTYSRQGMSPIMPRSPQHYGYLGESAGCHPSRHRNFISDHQKVVGEGGDSPSQCTSKCNKSDAIL